MDSIEARMLAAEGGDGKRDDLAPCAVIRAPLLECTGIGVLRPVAYLWLLMLWSAASVSSTSLQPAVIPTRRSLSIWWIKGKGQAQGILPWRPRFIFISGWIRIQLKSFICHKWQRYSTIQVHLLPRAVKRKAHLQESHPRFPAGRNGRTHRLEVLGRVPAQSSRTPR